MIAVSESATKESVLFKQMFDRCVEETITEAQVQRVLAPVLAMIRAGVFSQPWYKRTFWLHKRIRGIKAVESEQGNVHIARKAETNWYGVLNESNGARSTATNQ